MYLNIKKSKHIPNQVILNDFQDLGGVYFMSQIFFLKQEDIVCNMYLFDNDRNSNIPELHNLGNQT